MQRTKKNTLFNFDESSEVARKKSGFKTPDFKGSDSEVPSSLVDFTKKKIKLVWSQAQLIRMMTQS